MADKPTELPRRRFVLKLKIGADTREDMLRELDQIRDELVSGLTWGDVACGGPTAGYTLHVSDDPTVTHDSYMEAIKNL